MKEAALAKKELETLRKELAGVQKLNDDHKTRLTQIDGHISGVVSQKEEDLEAYRNKVQEL